MKEIEKTVDEPVYKTVQVGTKSKKIKCYQTEDGLTFEDKAEAKRHENQLEFENIDHVREDTISELGMNWYRAKDDKEVEFLKNALGSTYSTSFGFDNIRPGVWFNYLLVDGGDYRDTIYITTLPELEKEFSDLLSLLKDYGEDKNE